MVAYKINKGIISQRTKKGLSLFDPEKSTICHLNDSAAFIFKKLRQGWSEDKIVTSLTDTYKITEGKAKQDVEDFIQDLLGRDILVKARSH